MMIKHPKKTRYLAPIHCAKRALGMDDESYRALLQRVAGVRSSRDLSPKAAGRVLDEFRRLGWADNRDKSRGRPHNFSELPHRIRKIEAQLADLGLPWSYADGVARQMYQVQRVAWLRRPDQLDAVIAALHREQVKRTASAIDARLAELGVSPGDLVQGALPDGWQRNLRILRLMSQALGSMGAAGEAHQ